mmetsp:Transcript_15477/g.22426  ORF Transcript_15477/g.22426 Transcript_15477/m.22426 type:complete len:159 (-) Transcript_15477:79-555(-)
MADWHMRCITQQRSELLKSKCFPIAATRIQGAIAKLQRIVGVESSDHNQLASVLCASSWRDESDSDLIVTILVLHPVGCWILLSNQVVGKSKMRRGQQSTDNLYIEKQKAIFEFPGQCMTFSFTRVLSTNHGEVRKDDFLCDRPILARIGPVGTTDCQ